MRALGYDPNARFPMGFREPIYAEHRPGLTEALIGAAFVIAQEHIGKPQLGVHSDINTVANFWKHRDEWGLDWGNAPKPNGKRLTTKEAVENMGETAPMIANRSVGQLRRLAEKALGKPFTTRAL